MFVRFAVILVVTGPKSQRSMESAFKAGGMQLVTVPIDYSENQGVLIDELTGLGSS
jgi:PleD family two-component response regulator